MPASRVLGVAGAIGAVLYVMLDSGVVRPEPAPRILSVSLVVLALMFAVGAWAAPVARQPHRRPWLAGLALGLAGYAILRLFAF